MRADTAALAAMSDPERNWHFRRGWADPPQKQERRLRKQAPSLSQPGENTSVSTTRAWHAKPPRRGGAVSWPYLRPRRRVSVPRGPATLARLIKDLTTRFGRIPTDAEPAGILATGIEHVGRLRAKLEGSR